MTVHWLACDLDRIGWAARQHQRDNADQWDFVQSAIDAHVSLSRHTLCGNSCRLGSHDELLCDRLRVVGRSNITPMITGVKSYKEPVVPPRLRALCWALLLALIFAVLLWGLAWMI